MKQKMWRSAPIITALLISALVLTVMVPPASSDSWPIFFHDPQHTGASTFSAPDSNIVVWTAPKSVGGNGYSSPVAANGKVFVTRGVRLTCLYLENGTEVWGRDVQPASTASSSPTVAEGKVFVTGNRLYCFHENNGTAIWDVPLTGVRGTSSATVMDGRVYVNTQVLTCFDAESGEEIWNATIGGNGYSSPAVSNGRVYVNGHKLYCFNGVNGSEIWSAPGGNGTSPVIVNGRVIIKPDQLLVYYENNGTLVWSRPNGGEGYATPAAANGRMYVHGFDDDNDIFFLACLYEENGTEIWRFILHTEGCSSPAVSADNKVIINAIGKTHCLDGETGREIWSYDTGGPGYSTPALYNGSVIVNQEIVYCFRDPDVDYILIRDAPGGRGSNLCDPENFPSLPGGTSPVFYGAIYSNIIGYMDDVPLSSEWTSSNSTLALVNETGSSTVLQLNMTNIGSVTITLDDGQGHVNSTVLTVVGPTVDYIQVKDSPGGQGSVVSALTLLSGESATLHCSAFNRTVGYLGDSEVNWSVSGISGDLYPVVGASTNFTFTDVGSGIITADFKGMIFNVMISINPGGGPVLPEAPAGLRVEKVKEGGSLRLSWEANQEEDLAGYNIYRSRQNGSGFERVNTDGPVTDNTFVDSGLSEGRTYFYRITAVDGSGNESQPSTIMGSTPLPEEEDHSTVLFLALVAVITIILLIIGLLVSKRRGGENME